MSFTQPFALLALFISAAYFPPIIQVEDRDARRDFLSFSHGLPFFLIAELLESLQFMRDLNVGTDMVSRDFLLQRIHNIYTAYSLPPPA